MAYQLYWGDLHSHCSISYGYGTVEQALARARQQLDFCSITGHAFWPDMPTDRERYGEIIDYHREGFARLAGNWEKLLSLQEAGSTPGEFVALPSYEWHSMQYGDHNVYSRGPQLELHDAPDLPALRAMAAESGAIIIPHHIGYAAGYRGIDWRHFRAERSPFVEIFSLHGSSEGESSPYPMLHDMGPRDFGSTAEAGWAMGHRFGVIGSTDHHAAYPGSHGDGRLGVFAEALTRDALWEALLARRVFAATGDCIDARLTADDAWIGAKIQAPGSRRLRLSVRGIDALDRVELLKNGRVIKQFFPQPQEIDKAVSAFRLRITWGWGRKDRPVHWNARLSLSEGAITDVQSCFSGQAVAAPKGVAGHTASADEEDLPHEVVERRDHYVAWRSVTSGNPSLRHDTTQALSLGIDAPLSANIVVEVNGQHYEHPLAELLHAGRAHYLRGWLSEAIRIGPLVPLSQCVVDAELSDEPESDVDRYYLRASQHNGQWVWLSPIWAER
jgi:hypothetical protein